MPSSKSVTATAIAAEKSTAAATAEHFYQNQVPSLLSLPPPPPPTAHNDKKRKQRAAAAEPATSGGKTFAAINEQPMVAIAHSASSGSSGIAAASTASSERALIAYEKRVNVSFCFLVLAILALLVALVALAITFIFPFWMRLTVRATGVALNATSAPPPLFLLNVTNTLSQIELVVPYANATVSETVASLADDGGIAFDVGVWEVKMRASLALISANRQYDNAFPLSMLWLAADMSNESGDAFLVFFAQFICLRNVDLFVIQILEILHIVFTFLAFCSTAFTLCLCANQRNSLCWYLICFIMCMVALLCGAAVLILVVMWQSMAVSSLRDQHDKPVTLSKSFGWAFWLAVGVNASIVLAALLVLLYILAAALIIRQKRLDSGAKWRDGKHHQQHKQNQQKQQQQQQRHNHQEKDKKASSKANDHLAPFATSVTVMGGGMATTSGSSYGGAKLAGNQQMMSSGFMSKAVANGGAGVANGDFLNTQVRLPRLQPSFSVLPPIGGHNHNQVGGVGQGNSSGALLAYQDQQQSAAFQPIAPAAYHMISAADVAQLHQQQQQLSQFASPSYIFYTGHGNYHKQAIPNIDPEQVRVDDDDTRPEYEPPTDFLQPQQIINYSMMIQNQKNMLGNSNSNSSNNNNNNRANGVTGGEHPYSNVTDNQSDFRYFK